MRGRSSQETDSIGGPRVSGYDSPRLTRNTTVPIVVREIVPASAQNRIHDGGTRKAGLFALPGATDPFSNCPGPHETAAPGRRNIRTPQRVRRRSSCVASLVLRVLEPAAQAQLSQARELLAAVRDALVEFGAAPEDRAALASSIRQLEELFLIVIVGEFN